MPIGFIKKITVFLMLGFLVASAFFVRLENFKNSRMRSIDEIVYYRMAKQVLGQGLSGYNTIPYGKELAAKGRFLPEYFFQPLFKHPPVFTFLAALSMKIFGAKFISAEYISLLLSVLMIPLIYLLGTMLYGRRVGLLSALFLWIDPVNIICSQKVWMDTTIAFFTLLAAVFFIGGLKSNRDWFFVVSGFSGGLAVNTKYTGIFITLIIVIYSAFYQRELFKKKKFLFSQALPFMMLLPWLFWNYKVYGVTAVLHHREIMLAYQKVVFYVPLIIIVTGIALISFYILNKRWKKVFNESQPACLQGNSKWFQYLSFLSPLVLFIYLIPEQFLHSLQFDYVPSHSWQQGTFANEPAVFYFGRLLEYSFIYTLSFFAVLTYHPHRNNIASFISLCAMMILIFFIVWGSFQSRYILSCLPFFIILGSQLWVAFLDKVSESDYWVLRVSGKSGLIVLLVYIISKTFYLNSVMSYPNDMCYF